MQVSNVSLDLDLYDEATLLERLSGGLKDQGRPVIFVLGSALTAPVDPGKPGVPGVEGVIDLIEAEFSEPRKRKLRERLSNASNRYQEAFRFLLGGRGPHVANGIIKQAVAMARILDHETGLRYRLDGNTNDEICRSFESDLSGWSLTPAAEALGKLIVRRFEQFGRMVITTNFDPLIGVSIAKFGGHHFRTILHGDGNVNQAKGDGTHIVHLHGYWYGSDTLHTPRQLIQPRPQLQSSLSQVLRDSVIVVLGYGGWDDTFMQALTNVVTDDSAFPEVIWTFYEEELSGRTELLTALAPGIDRGRVTLYSGVNCHTLLPALAQAWDADETKSNILAPLPEHQSFNWENAPPLSRSAARLGISALENRAAASDSDNPPRVEYVVGRESDLAQLDESTARAIFITGIGGQGKSAVAATYYLSERSANRYDHRIWRDCREQSGRFEDQIVSVIGAINDGSVSGAELSKQPLSDLAILFARLTSDLKLLIVFDNVDHYVDLERQVLSGTMGDFLSAFLNEQSKATLVFTCRPALTESHPSIFAKRLEGIDLLATKELFSLRGAPATDESIERAYAVTAGHPFWLDLLAAQVANRSPQIALDDLLQSISSGTGEIPDATLRSIWNSLRVREQVVLQSLAETVRPPTALQLSDYLRAHIQYNQFSKALRLIRDLNLVVVKINDDDEETFELHPVIRAFIVKTIPRSLQVPFIEAILAAFAPFFGLHRKELTTRSDPRVIARWIEGAELSINSGRFAEAMKHLSEVQRPVRKSQPPGEFVRVARLLLECADASDLAKLPDFDEVISSYVRLLVNLGKVDEASDALARYRETMPAKDARYINYCDLQSYLHWTNGNYPAAIRWAQEGVDLKKKSGVDTEFSADHALALAERDSGAYETALEFFLGDAKLDEIIDPASYDEDRGGGYYGNIGRCLHLMGQIDTALICYRKSAYAVEEENVADHLENQGYIRQWIGELLLIRGEVDAAKLFLKASYSKWEIVSPPRAERVMRTFSENFDNAELDALSKAACEQFALSWIRSGFRPNAKG
ncbi:MAG TPA: SIR2 family protein [Allosphingosinicella sp.]|nr:SIR2 family protein [Allosphingosinicella sp.]